MKKLRECVINGSNYMLCFLALSILIFLTSKAFTQGIYLYDTSMTEWMLVFYRLFLVILLVSIVGIVSVLFKCLKINMDIFEKVFVAISAIVILVVALYWCYIVPYYPDGDQLIVWQGAVFMLSGDFQMFQHGGYINIYPQQKGLMLLYELLFRCFGSVDFVLISYMNAITAPVALVFGYLTIKEIFKKRSVGYVFILLFCGFFPYLIYTVYNYGDMPVVAFLFLFIWSMLKYRNTSKTRYLIIASIALSFALIFRLHTWIVIIAVAVGSVYEWIRTKHVNCLVGTAIAVLCAVAVVQLIAWQYAIRSDYEIEKGMASILWVAMGLQYSENGAGQYNNYSKEVYYSVDGDYELSMKIAIENINSRIEIFKTYPDQTWMFFREKITSQWNNPLFESILETSTFQDEEVDELVQKVYYGAYYTALQKYTTSYQFIIYFLASVGVAFAALKSKNILNKVPLIIFVGGFLFCLVWEAKARYMLPFFVMLIPYAAYAICELWKSFQYIGTRNKNNMKN